MPKMLVDGGVEYFAAVRGGRTRSEAKYARVSLHEDGRQPHGVPCSVTDGPDGRSVVLRNRGPEQIDDTDGASSFMEFLRGWGGEWMWTNVRNEGANCISFDAFGAAIVEPELHQRAHEVR